MAVSGALACINLTYHLGTFIKLNALESGTTKIMMIYSLGLILVLSFFFSSERSATRFSAVSLFQTLRKSEGPLMAC